MKKLYKFKPLVFMAALPNIKTEKPKLVNIITH